MIPTARSSASDDMVLANRHRAVTHDYVMNSHAILVVAIAELSILQHVQYMVHGAMCWHVNPMSGNTRLEILIKFLTTTIQLT
jgi:hypothetical protein